MRMSLRRCRCRSLLPDSGRSRNRWHLFHVQMICKGSRATSWLLHADLNLLAPQRLQFAPLCWRWDHAGVPCSAVLHCHARQLLQCRQTRCLTTASYHPTTMYAMGYWLLDIGSVLIAARSPAPHEDHDTTGLCMHDGC